MNQVKLFSFLSKYFPLFSIISSYYPCAEEGKGRRGGEGGKGGRGREGRVGGVGRGLIILRSKRYKIIMFNQYESREAFQLSFQIFSTIFHNFTILTLCGGGISL